LARFFQNVPLQAFSENRPSEPHSYWVEPSKSAEIGHELSNPGAPLNELLDRGWTFVSATPFGVDLSGAGQTSIAYGAATMLVIVEWRRSGSPK